MVLLIALSRLIRNIRQGSGHVKVVLIGGICKPSVQVNFFEGK